MSGINLRAQWNGNGQIIKKKLELCKVLLKAEYRLCWNEHAILASIECPFHSSRNRMFSTFWLEWSVHFIPTGMEWSHSIPAGMEGALHSCRNEVLFHS